MEPPKNGDGGKCGLNLAAVQAEVAARAGTVAPDPPSTNGTKPEVVRDMEEGLLETDQERREREKRERIRSRWRSRLHWAIGALDAKGGHKTFLQVLTLLMDRHKKGPDRPYLFAGRRKLQGHLSASESTFYRHLGRARERGHVEQWSGNRRSKNRAVTVELTEADESALYDLWYRCDNLDDPDPYAAWLERHRLRPPTRSSVRYIWRRGLRDSDLDTATKGVGLAASLLWNGKGELYRKTSIPELRRLSGYSERPVRENLPQLEDAGWLFLKQKSKAGDDNGTWLWPRIPDRQIEPIKREYLR